MAEPHPAADHAERQTASGRGPQSLPAGTGSTCPVCGAPRSDHGGNLDRYDEDYEYYWGDVRIPLWIALIWNVPWRQRLDIFVIGFLVGLVIAAAALLWGLILARY